jgi:hypothetical protein
MKSTKSKDPFKVPHQGSLTTEAEKSPSSTEMDQCVAALIAAKEASDSLRKLPPVTLEEALEQAKHTGPSPEDVEL